MFRHQCQDAAMCDTVLAELQIYSLVTTYGMHCHIYISFHWHISKQVNFLCALYRCLTAFYGTHSLLYAAVFLFVQKQCTGIMLGYARDEAGFGVAGDPAARSVQVCPFSAR